jgi:uncharacterized membrane protein (TIGR02234 family)
VNARRELTAAAVLCAVGAGTAVLAGGRSWATVRASDAITPLSQHVTGRELTGGAVALGWAGLAGLAALFATRGRVRALVGALLGLFGAGIVYTSVTATGHAHILQVAGDKSALMRLGGEAAVHTAPWWLASAAGGVLLGLGGLLTLVRGARWPGMSARYERTTAGSEGAAVTPDRRSAGARARADDPSLLWKSLDRGVDPTDDPGEPGNGANLGDTDHPDDAGDPDDRHEADRRTNKER